MKQSNLKKIGLLTLAVILCSLPAYMIFRSSWKMVLAHRIEAALEQRGLSPVSLTIGSVGWRSAEIEDISIGDSQVLQLKHLVVDYNPAELKRGYLQNMRLTELTLDVRHGRGGWRIGGLDSYMQRTPASDKPLFIPG